MHLLFRRYFALGIDVGAYVSGSVFLCTCMLNVFFLFLFFLVCKPPLLNLGISGTIADVLCMYARLFGSGYHNPNGLAGIILGRGLFVFFFLSFFRALFTDLWEGLYLYFYFTIACLPTPFPGTQWSDSPRLFGMCVAASRDRTHRYAKPLPKKDPTRCDLGPKYESVKPKGSIRQSRVRDRASSFPKCSYR